MRTSIKNNKGFSLVELMVVVAIIGILAAVAIPNFARFSAKAKQSEAKAQLSMVYSSQASFQGEWQSYTGDFAQIGFKPQGQLKYRILSAAYNGSTMGNYAGPLYNAANITTTAAGVCGAGCAEIVGTAAISGCAPAVVAVPATTATTFTAAAAGTLTPGAAADEWTITQAKLTANAFSGLP